LATPGNRLLPLIARDGHIIIVVGGNRRCTFPVGPFYLQNCTIHGFTVTGTGVERLQSYARQINGWLSSGVLSARIHEILPLSETAQAHQMQEQGNLFGKIVLVPDASEGA